MGNDIKLSPPKETFREILKKTVVFRTYTIKEKAIAIVPKEEVEKVLGALMYKVEYIGRGRLYTSVRAIFETPEMSRDVSTMSFKSKSNPASDIYGKKNGAHLNRRRPTFV